MRHSHKPVDISDASVAHFYAYSWDIYSVRACVRVCICRCHLINSDSISTVIHSAWQRYCWIILILCVCMHSPALTIAVWYISARSEEWKSFSNQWLMCTLHSVGRDDPSERDAVVFYGNSLICSSRAVPHLAHRTKAAFIKSSPSVFPLRLIFLFLHNMLP